MQRQVTSFPDTVKNLIHAGSLTLLASQPHLCKSELAKHLAVQVVQGKPLLDRETTKGSVLLLDLDRGKSKGQIAHELKRYGYDPNKGLPRFMTAAELLAIPPVEASIKVISALPFDTPRGVFGNVEEAIAHTAHHGRTTRLLIIDSFPGSKIGKTPGKVFDCMWNLIDKYPELSIVLTHPCGKSPRKDPYDSISGSIAWRYEASTEILLREKKGKLTIESLGNYGIDIPLTELLRTDDGPVTFQLGERISE